MQASDTTSGAQLSYNVQGTNGSALPTGSLSPTGTLTIEPAPSDAGQTFNLTIIASDGTNQATTNFTVTVPADTNTSTRVSGVVESETGAPIQGVPVAIGSATATIQGDDDTSSGTYSFRIVDLAAAPALPFNTTVSGTLNPGQLAQIDQFSGRSASSLSSIRSSPRSPRAWPFP